MKKYTFMYPYDRETTLKHILRDTKEMKFYPYGEGLLSKVSKDRYKVSLCYGIGYKNSFIPIMKLKLTENNGQTKVEGKWRWHIHTEVIFALYLLFALFAAVLVAFSGDFAKIIYPLLVAVWGIGIGLFGILIERKHMKEILEHLQKGTLEGKEEL